MPELSYKTIQRRLRTINLQLGTEYKASKVYRQQVEAEKYGQTTWIYESIRAVRGTRSDVKTSQILDDSAGRYWIYNSFQALGERQKQVYNLIHAKSGDFIDNKGRVWKKTETGYEIAGGGITVRSLPKSAVPYTTKRAYTAIKAIRDEMEVKGKGQPQYVYTDQDVTVYLD